MSVLRRTKLTDRRRGFTLLEMMVALSIIAIVLVSVYRLQSQTILMNIRSRFDTIAPMLAGQKLVETEQDLKDAGSASGDFGDDYPGFAWEVKVTEVTSEMLGQVAEDMRQIDVKVFFQDESNSYEIKAYRLLNVE